MWLHPPIPVHERCPPIASAQRWFTRMTHVHTLRFTRCTHSAAHQYAVDALKGRLGNRTCLYKQLCFVNTSLKHTLTSITLSGCINDAHVWSVGSCTRLHTFRIIPAHASHTPPTRTCFPLHVLRQLAARVQHMSHIEFTGVMYCPSQASD